VEGQFKIVVSIEGAKLAASSIDKIAENTAKATAELEKLNKRTKLDGAKGQIREMSSALRRLQDQLDPVGALQRRLAQDTKVLASAMKKGKIDAQQYAEMLAKLAAQQRNGVAAISKSYSPNYLGSERQRMKEQAAQATALDKLRNSYAPAQKGSEAQRFKEQAAAQQRAAAEATTLAASLRTLQAAMDPVVAIEQKLAAETKVLTDSFARGKISAEQYITMLAKVRADASIGVSSIAKKFAPDQLGADAQRAKEAEARQRQIAKSAAESAKFASGFSQLRGSLDPVYASQQKLAAGTKQLDEAMKRGLITGRQYSGLMRQLKADTTTGASGINKFGQVIRNNHKALNGFDSAAHRLRQSLFAFGALFFVRELAQMADGWTNLGNRMKLVTSSAAEASAAQNQVLQIALETRQPLEDVGHLFTRVSLATKSMGKSNKDVLQVTKNLGKAIVLSGASTQEAAAGLRQFSQALASGRLQGDEFRSVMENIPYVADLIAEHLGVTRGELYKLRTEGKLTGKVLFDSLFGATAKLDKLFAGTIPTIGQGFTVLKSALAGFVGNFGANTGAAENFARGLIYVSQNIEGIARVLAASAIYAGLAKLTLLMRGVTLASPVGILLSVAKAAALAGAYIAANADKLNATSDGLTKLSDVIGPVFGEIKGAASDIFQTLKDMGELLLKLANGPGYELQDLLIDTAVAFRGIIHAAVETAVRALQFLDRARNLLPNAITGKTKEEENTAAIVSAKNRTADRLREQNRLEQELIQQIEIANLAGGSSSVIAKAAKTVAEARVEGLVAEINAGEEELEKSLKYAEGVEKRIGKTFQQEIDELLAAMNGREGGKSSDTLKREARANRDARLAREAAQPEKDRLGQEALDAKRKGEAAAAANDKASKAQADAFSKLEQEINPDPLLKYNEALTVLQKRLASTGDAEEFNFLMGKLNTHYKEAIDPVGAYADANKKLAEEIRLSNYGFEVEAKLRERITALMEKGHKLHYLEIAQIKQQVEVERVLNKEKEKKAAADSLVSQLKEQARTPIQKLRDDQKLIEFSATGSSIDDRAAAWYENRRQQNKILEEEDAKAKEGTFGKKLSDEIKTFSDVIEDQGIASINKFADTWATFVTTGKFQFADFANSVIADLARIATQQLILGIVKGAVNVYNGGNFFNQMRGGSTEILSNATGGSYRVGGFGGYDSQMFQSRVSPGERVDVLTPAQQRAQAAAMQGGGGSPIVNTKVIVVSNMKEAALEALNSEDGERVTIKHMQRNGIR